MTSLRDRRKNVDEKSKRDALLKEIRDDYEKNGHFKMEEIKGRNIMIIGRTRSGKSTIKSLMLDPTKVPNDLTLKSGTREAHIVAYHIEEKKACLNIIDTPGLFERAAVESEIRNNEAILKTIEKCANMEITSFHVICFCVAITAGINGDDVRSIELFMEFLGDGISKNACLIITHCESKNEEQCKKIEKELQEDIFFKKIAPYFKLGIFFSGCINRDNYNNANDCIQDEFLAVCDYRQKLIDLFTNDDIKPFPITETKISEIRRANEEKIRTQDEYQKSKNLFEEQAAAYAELLPKYEAQGRLLNKMKIQLEDYKCTASDAKKLLEQEKRDNEDLRRQMREQKSTANIFMKRWRDYEDIIRKFLANSDWQTKNRLQQEYPTCDILKDNYMHERGPGKQIFNTEKWP